MMLGPTHPHTHAPVQELALAVVLGQETIWYNSGTTIGTTTVCLSVLDFPPFQTPFSSLQSGCGI